MCRAAFAIITIFGLVGPAAAQTRFAAPHTQPTAAGMQGASVEPASHDPTTTGAVANAQARARMGAFDRRLETRNNRALGSICPACSLDAKRHKWAGRRIEASANASEFPIEDPAQAPVD